MTDTRKLARADTQMVEASIKALEEAARELTAAQIRLAKTRESIELILRRASIERGQSQWFRESMP